MLILGGIVAGLVLIVGLLDPGLLTVGGIRITGFLRSGRKKLSQSPDGFRDTMDAKKVQLQKSLAGMIDQIAGVRASIKTQKSKLETIRASKTKFERTRDEVLRAAEAAEAGSEKFNECAKDLAQVEQSIGKLSTEEAALMATLSEYEKELEEAYPHMEELKTQIGDTEHDKELGLIALEVAKVQKERAARKGLLAGGTRTYVDEAAEEAKQFVAKEVEAGKMAAEQVGSTADAIADKYRTTDKTNAERLAAVLAERKAKEAPATPGTAAPETLTK
jgi:chromosome segregation ATPase